MGESEDKRHQQPYSAPHPNAAEIEPENRRLDQHPHQTAEVPYGSGDQPEIAGHGGLDPEPAAKPNPTDRHTDSIEKK
ncbi:hypothetical protein [Caballeronia sp. LZ035]|uniref:hypothetical protein n=1 Tax=Caballeronia sp. LZ035 TaxID=3038568 RepID=UPI00285D35E3|nr:hypothetical protein [Caballeronia sp. LZ035]MDR5762618.1 hypothetical protein [Caballeronia sp. LZ035]